MQQLVINRVLCTICVGAVITLIAIVLCPFILSGRLGEQERRR